MKIKLALWGIGVAAVVVVLIAITAKVTISRCTNDFRCISQYQYYYLTAMNNAISRYGGDIFVCTGANVSDAVEYLTLEDESSSQLTCRKLDKGNEGIITRMFRPSSVPSGN